MGEAGGLVRQLQKGALGDGRTLFVLLVHPVVVAVVEWACVRDGETRCVFVMD